MKATLSESTFDLPEKEVHLWHCRFDANKRNIETFKRILSDDEKEKAAKFKFDIHREQAVISRGVLRTLLGKYIKKHPHDLRFGYTEFGKPFLKENSSLGFNVSHSGNRAIFGFVHHAEIGVDIEKRKDDFEVMEIAQHFFSSDEILALENLPQIQRISAFYRCWTRKESFIKAKGSGLSFSLSSFSVSLDVDGAKLLRTNWDAAEKGEWRLYSLAPEKNYLAALSVRGDINAVRQRDWDELLL